VDKSPDRALIHFEATIRQFRGKFAQGEITGFYALKKPFFLHTGNQIRPVTPHLPRRHAPGYALALRPANDRCLA